MTDNADKGFFDRLGELLNTPLPGTQASPSEDSGPATTPAETDADAGLLAHIRDILNAPLPGTVPAESSGGQVQPSAPAPSREPSTEGTGRAPSPPSTSGPVSGSATEARPMPDTGEQMQPPAPDLAEDVLEEDWWRRDWDAFKAHQAQEGRGLELKQSQDREKFAAFQEQERRRFAAHQGQEEAAFRQHQQWKLNTWRQYQEALKSGRPVPPPPFALPPGAPMPPGMPVPPGMSPRGPMPWPMGGPGMPLPPWMRRPR
jgi:hypothetical protein